MTFSQLRLNSPIYILHKDATPYVECGQVTNVSAPMPQLGNLPNMGQPLQYTVDVTVRVGESVTRINGYQPMRRWQTLQGMATCSFRAVGKA